MPIPPHTRKRLADLMDGRRTELRLRWQDVSEAGDVSIKAIYSARNGVRDIHPLTQRGIEEGLRWEPGSIERILDGGDPVPAGGTPAGGFPAVAAEQPAEDEGIPSWEDMTPEERQLARGWIAILRKTQGRRAG